MKPTAGRRELRTCCLSECAAVALVTGLYHQIFRRWAVCMQDPEAMGLALKALSLNLCTVDVMLCMKVGIPMEMPRPNRS